MEWKLFGQILALLLFAAAILWIAANLTLADARGWAAKARAVPAGRYLVAVALVLGAAAAFWLVPGQPPPRGKLTAAEERKLDEAAKMLDENMNDVLPESLGVDAAEFEGMEANEGALNESPPGNGR